MRKHLSVLALWVRNGLSRVLLLLALMAVFETALFAWQLPRHLEHAVEASLRGIPLISAVTFLALSFHLCYSGDTDRATGCLLGRLAIGEKTALLWKGLFNTLCLLLFWAVQTALAVLFCRWYAAALPEAYRSAQTVFLAFYRDPFLHALLPLSEGIGYLRNLLLAAGLGLEAANSAYRRRHGGYFPLALLLALCAVMFFRQKTGDLTAYFWLGPAAALCAGLDLFSIYTVGEEEAE